MAAKHTTYYDKSRYPRIHLFGEAFYDSRGMQLGWLTLDSIQNMRGAVVGWMKEDMLYDRSGFVVARRGQTVTINRGLPLGRPNPSGRLGKPAFSPSWSDVDPSQLFESDMMD
ncbi:MAG: hypothetical protein FJX76_11235 [Armatimonadetes bacterium]|nr:hypothetical protein [Armatimonadota bacterium]